MAMCHRLHSENGMFSMKEAKVRECIQRVFKREGVIIGVIGDPGQIEASICLVISDNWYTEDWHLAETWNYVLPEYRRSNNAEALLVYGMACAEKMRIPFFTGIITNKQMAGKVRMYRRLLGYPVGAFFVYNSNWKTEPMVDHSELHAKLKKAIVRCTDGKVSTSVARKEIGPLLKEAAEAISREDNIWGQTPKKTPSAIAHANGTD